MGRLLAATVDTRRRPGDRRPVGDSTMAQVSLESDPVESAAAHGHRRFKRTALAVLGTWNLLVLLLLLAVVVEKSTPEIDSAFKNLALLGVLDAFVLGNALLLVIGSVTWIAVRRHDRRRVLVTT